MHSINSGGLNDYQKAIKSVGEILINYDHDKIVPVYGFGGKPSMPNLRTNNNATLHCFPLNGNPENPNVDNLQGILDTYEYAIKNCILSGPTLFNPIITQTMNICREFKSEGNKEYAILLILTDGTIHDMEETKKVNFFLKLIKFMKKLLFLINFKFEKLI